MRHWGSILLAMVIVLACGKTGTDSCGVRISWDRSTYQELRSVEIAGSGEIEENLYYPRAKRLSDGSILLSFSNDHYGWDIYTCRSTDDGQSWGKATLLRKRYPATSSVGEDEVVFVNPDFIELHDGRVMLVYQWRYKKGYNDIANTNVNCGIEMVTSEDKGLTWSNPRKVYIGRCWEPALVQLPSGEIQMLITSSQEIRENISCPRTVIIRSYDGGATWQGKECCNINDNETISRTVDDRFGFDGMPSGVIMDDGRGIIVPLEVWSGKYAVDQTPVVTKTTLEENWSFDQEDIVNNGGPTYPAKKQVNKDLIGYGPYCTKLGSGEVVVQCNGRYKGVQSVWTLVGDKDGDNFHFATTPFEGYWGSIDYIGNNTVLSTATYQYKDEDGHTRGLIKLIKGRLNYPKEVHCNGLTLLTPDEFIDAKGNMWFLGDRDSSSVRYDFGNDGKHFLLAAYLSDNNIVAKTPENSDAAVIIIGRKGRKGRYHIFKVAMNALGNNVLYEEERYSWKTLATGLDTEVMLDGTINDDSDRDKGYAIRIEIPWNLLGGSPRLGEEIKIHPCHHIKDKVAEKPAYEFEELGGGEKTATTHTSG